MKYIAADHLSTATVDLDRNFGDMLVRAGILEAVPEARPLLPNESLTVFENGVPRTIRKPMVHKITWGVAESQNKEPYISGECSGIGCAPKFMFTGSNPATSKPTWHAGAEWPIPADVCALYLKLKEKFNQF